MLKVLIAEDNIMLADMLEGYLASRGYEVCGVACNVDEAIELANLHKPDLAVLDFCLGEEHSSDIYARVRDKNLGIIYVSGRPLREKLTRVNGDAYIQKPYGMEDLVRGLQIVQGLKENRSASIPFPKSFHLLEDPDPGQRSFI